MTEHDKQDAIEIDGSLGEGGGQVLRSSLALSIITGTPVLLLKIRAGRKTPGLRRQHLTAVRAAAEICGAEVRGDALGSTELWFSPGAVKPDQYRFVIGTAGSTTLVLQTVLWPLVTAGRDSEVVVEGGTHNPMAPTFDFLFRSFFPAVRHLGVEANLTLERAGFYPAGGGRIRAQLHASTPRSYTWPARGKQLGVDGKAFIANLPVGIARRELGEVHSRLGWQRNALKVERLEADGPGNAISLAVTHESGTTVVSGIGEKGKKAERVAAEACEEMQGFLGVDAPIDEHLADQLLIPMALAGGGRFVTGRPSLHTQTNATVIETFLPVRFSMEALDEGRWSVSVTRRSPPT